MIHGRGLGVAGSGRGRDSGFSMLATLGLGGLVLNFEVSCCCCRSCRRCHEMYKSSVLLSFSLRAWASELRERERERNN